MRLHHLVTTHAGQPARLVRTAAPEHAVAFFVALEAGGVLLLRRGFRILAEAHRDRILASAGIYVRFARTMAGLAAKLLRRCARISKDLAHDRGLEMFDLLFMAGDASVIADIVGVRRCRGFRLCLSRIACVAGERRCSTQHNK